MAQVALFEEVFNRANIYEMLFFNVKAILEHPTLEDLEEKNKQMFERWKYLESSKYLNNGQNSQENYENNAVYYPEFTRIVAITYATLYAENGEIKREFKKVLNEDERIVLETFMLALHHISNGAAKLSPPFFPPLCGHNIISYDIPLLTKRFIKLSSTFETVKQLPFILKRSFSIKPWESGLIDTVNVWKFNGFDAMPLMLISDFLGLKRTTDLLPLPELSKYYWKNVGEKPKETLEFIGLQSANQTNLVIQLMNELRQL